MRKHPVVQGACSIVKEDRMATAGGVKILSLEPNNLEEVYQGGSHCFP